MTAPDRPTVAPLPTRTDPYDGLDVDAERPMTHGPSEVCRFQGPHPASECRLYGDTAGKPLVPSREKYRIDFLASHRTYKNALGKKIPGVTTVLGMLNKPALLRWAWQLGKDGIEMEKAREKAASIGTVAHALCEAHLRGMDFDSGNIAPDMLSKAETGFIRFLEFWDKEGLTVVACELPLISERMQVGGTLDILAGKANGSLVLCDIKTSKGLYDEMLIQASVYAAMYEEATGKTVDEVLIIRIGKEDAEDLEVRRVSQRPERVAAFAALADARRALLNCGMRV